MRVNTEMQFKLFYNKIKSHLCSLFRFTKLWIQGFLTEVLEGRLITWPSRRPDIIQFDFSMCIHEKHCLCWENLWSANIYKQEWPWPQLKRHPTGPVSLYLDQNWILIGYLQSYEGWPHQDLDVRHYTSIDSPHLPQFFYFQRLLSFKIEDFSSMYNLCFLMQKNVIPAFIIHVHMHRQETSILLSRWRSVSSHSG
jgi:hypothetical protein